MTTKTKPAPIVALVFFASVLMLLAACKPPTAPQPEIFKVQQDALDKAKDLEKQMQQLPDRMKDSDAVVEDKK